MGVTVNASAATLAPSGTVPSDLKPTSGTRSTLLTNRPSAIATSNWTAESTSPTQSGSGGVKRSGSRKKLGVKRLSKGIKKLDKTGRRSKVVPSPEKIKTKIPVSSTAASMAGASSGASSTREIPDVEVDDDGALIIPRHSSSGMDGASDP